MYLKTSIYNYWTNISLKINQINLNTYRSILLLSLIYDVGYNGFYKKKRLSKLSLIVDSNGIPISVLLAKGNKADPSLFNSNIDNLFVAIKSNNNNNKHKRYFLADAAYDSNKIKENIKMNNITPIIWSSKRRKDYKKFNSREINIYKKRIVIENCFSWIFKCRRTNRRYDKKVSNYLSFVYASLCKLLTGRI